MSTDDTLTNRCRESCRPPEYEEVQGRGNFDVFEELFADDFVDHTLQPNCRFSLDSIS